MAEFNIKFTKGRYVEFVSEERGIYSLDLVTMEGKIDTKWKRFNTPRKFFIGYGFGGNYSRNLWNNCRGDVEKVKKFFLNIRRRASRAYWGTYMKSNWGNILDDFFKCEKDPLKFQTKNQKILDILNSNLNFVIYDGDFSGFSNVKFKKGTKKLLVKYQVEICGRFIEHHNKQPELYDKIILMFDTERMIDNFFLWS